MAGRVAQNIFSRLDYWRVTHNCIVRVFIVPCTCVSILIARNIESSVISEPELSVGHGSVDSSRIEPIQIYI